MPIAGTATTPTYTAFVAATGLPVSNDQANHTLKLVTDGVQSSISPTITALANGEYAVPVTGSQNVGALMEISGASSTAGVVIAPSKWANTGSTPSGYTSVNQDTGGTDNLRFVLGNSGGPGVDGAIIYAYLSSDYALGNVGSAYVKGQSITGPVNGVSGRWLTPMVLANGASYTLVFSDSQTLTTTAVISI